MRPIDPHAMSLWRRRHCGACRALDGAGNAMPGRALLLPGAPSPSRPHSVHALVLGLHVCGTEQARLLARHSGGRRMTVWIDIDNPPQVRCMLPLARRFEAGGHDVLLTAREYGDTFAMLQDEGVAFERIGSSFGKGAGRKVYGLLKRTRQLVAFLQRQQARPRLVLTGSRAACLAARRLGIPSFVIIDYEYVNLSFYRLAGSYIAYPNVIEGGVLERQRIPRERLLPFDGLKEDIAFADIDLLAVAPYTFGGNDGSAPRVLFRPPAEDSHYYRSESREFALEVLRFLAAEGAQVVFSPRYPRQLAYLEEIPAF